MKVNSYEPGWEFGPKSRRMGVGLCAALLAGLMSSVVAADTSSNTLRTDTELPVVSRSAEIIGAVVKTAGQGMPVLAETRAPVIGAQAGLKANPINGQVGGNESPVADAPGQPSLMAASFNATEYALKPVNDAGTTQVAQTSTVEGRSAAVAAPEGDDQLQLPYALVLALLAIIGLVPVSRRNH